MPQILKDALNHLLPIGAGFAAGLAAAALISRSGLIELGDPADDETGDPENTEE